MYVNTSNSNGFIRDNVIYKNSLYAIMPLPKSNSVYRMNLTLYDRIIFLLKHKKLNLN